MTTIWENLNCWAAGCADKLVRDMSCMQHFSEFFRKMLHFGKIPKKFGENLARFSKKFSKILANFAKIL